jgi:putative transposase
LLHGILKTELISDNYPDLKTAMQHISRCITVYNYRRVHSSLNWQIPNNVHSQKGPQIKKWKNYYKTKNQNKEVMKEP